MNIKMNPRLLLLNFLILLFGIWFVKQIYLKPDEETVSVVSSFVFYDIETLTERHMSIFNLPLLSIFLSFLLCNISLVLENANDMDLKYMQLIRYANIKKYMIKISLNKLLINVIHICLIILLYIVCLLLNGIVFKSIDEWINICYFLLKVFLLFDVLTILFLYFQMFHEKENCFSLSVFLVIGGLCIYFLHSNINMICFSRRPDIFTVLIYIGVCLILLIMFIVKVLKTKEL
ncbi:hypothetical protein [[Eubacterium] hominis]|uniref:hypothetical protein n=1 Tax=[Eubacterium] hominis TaxID=2764325 RepID=UPI003A4E0941